MFKTSYCRTAVLALVLYLFACSAGAQQRATAIVVTGDVKQPLTLTAADLAKLPRAAVTTRNNTITAAWEGVWLGEILKKAGVPLGSALRGKALTTYVAVSASDGYEVLFSLGELDPDMTDAQILVADTANGKSLIDEGESFRLVIPKDKEGARSVRMLTKIEVIQVRK
jgi:DMSO/TMAO reductase YedYZ molybdopterin-dependent catalytic subunit